jgi:hypothetical protein
MAAREYRVTWQRQGLSRRSVLRQSAEAAERYTQLLRGQMQELHPDRDPDDYTCCDGSQDGCGGLTWREEWDRRSQQVPPLVLLRIDSREVGEWESGTAFALPVPELAMAGGGDDIPW